MKIAPGWPELHALWAVLLLAVCALHAGAPAAAQDLPWTDANPLAEFSDRRSGSAKTDPPVTRVAQDGEVPASDVIPVPDERPERPDEPGAAAGPTQPAEPEAAAGAEAAGDVARPDAEGDDAAGLPTSEIPVPEERPNDPAAAPDAAGAPPRSDPLASDPAGAPEGGGAAPASDAVPDAAPNAIETLKAREPEVTPEQSVLAAAVVEDAVACEAELSRRGIVFTLEPTISEGACGVLRPIAVERLSSGVVVSPKTQMLCRTVIALDDWMTEGVIPEAKRRFPTDTLTEFRHASTYVCRPRASESDISEHARGSAIDIAAFVFGGAREIGIDAAASAMDDGNFLQSVRRSACGPFKTVLGPGTDADHATHFHLDIAARKGGATYCK